MRLGRKIKIIFFTLLGLILTLFVVMALAVAWATKHPHEALAIAERYLLPEDLSIKFEEMDFQAHRATWRHWEIAWSTLKLNIEKGQPELRLPIEQASLRFNFRLFEDGPWLRFHELKVSAGESVLFRPSRASDDKSTQQSPYELLQGYLGNLALLTKWISVEDLAVDIPRLILIGEDARPSMTAQIKLNKPVGGSSSRATGFTVATEVGEAKIRAEGWLDSTRLNQSEPFLYLNAEVDAKSWHTKARLAGVYLSEHGQFTGSSQFTYGEGVKAQSKIKLNVSASEALLNIESAVHNIPGPLSNLDKLQADVRVPFDKGFLWSERPAVFKVWAPVDLFFIDKNMRPSLEKSCRCKFPEALVVTYEGRGWPEALLGKPQQSTTVIDSKLSVEGIDNKLLTVNLAAHIKVNKQLERWILEPRLDSQVTIQSFQVLRKFLDARNVMIPAPFDVLDGKIHVGARSSVAHDDKVLRSMVEIKVELASYTQKVFVESNVNLDLARDFKALDIFIHSLIHQIRIELPPLDPIRGIPSLFTDPRLVFKEPKRAAKPSKFKVRVFFDVKTTNPGAVQLLSTMAAPYAPVTIDINNSNKGESAGSVRLEPFDITYLRRKVHVERLQVTLAEDEVGDFPVGGRFRLDQTSYRIFVDVAGTLDSPIVNLNSEPFLPRPDIISVLLFDRVNEQLVSADADMAGSFEAALADRAIGLFGLWAFATTPIRSFSYNAVTKVYTATVQLADGLTAGVGTNWERATHLEVRKRVSRRWVLTASWSPTGDHEQIGKLVLQWEKRF